MNVTKEEMKSKIMNIARDNKLPEAEVTMTPGAEDVTPVAVSVEPMEDESQMLYNLPSETVAELQIDLRMNIPHIIFTEMPLTGAMTETIKKLVLSLTLKLILNWYTLKGYKNIWLGSILYPPYHRLTLKELFLGYVR